MNPDKKHLSLMIFACRRLARSKNRRLQAIAKETLPKLMKEWRWLDYRIDEIPGKWADVAELSWKLEAVE